MCTAMPEIAEPLLAGALVTMTAMNAGSDPAGGGVEFPGSALHLAPHVGVVGSSANPLKLAVAMPPSEFSFAHCAPQNVTELPNEPFGPPITKLPPPGAKENPIVLHDVTAAEPPVSVTVVVMVKLPVVAYECEPETE